MTRAERIAENILNINAIRDAREDAIREKRVNLALNDPKYKELLDKKTEIEHLIISTVKKTGEISQHDKIGLDSIKNELSAYENANDIDCTPSCHLCSDTGYSNGSVCDCVIKRLTTSAFEIKSLLPSYDLRDRTTINNLLQNTPQETAMQGIYSNFIKYAERYPNISLKNIILIGGSGCGKSGAVLSLYNELTRLGHKTLYLNAFAMHTAFLKYHTSPLEQKSQHLDTLLETDFLVIDDLGTEPIFKNVTLEYLYLLLETRISTGKASVITTNLTKDALLERYGERLVSRMTSKSYTFTREISACSDLRAKK